MNRWKIGDVTITRVVESETATDLSMLLPDATPENIRKEEWLRPHFADDNGGAKLSIHAYAIESGGRKIIVDTCVGNDKRRDGFPTMHMLRLPFLSDLAEAGFARESVNLVLCTHLHLDHVGWNTMLERERWVPTFPNARYLIGRKEWAQGRRQRGRQRNRRFGAPGLRGGAGGPRGTRPSANRRDLAGTDPRAHSRPRQRQDFLARRGGRNQRRLDASSDPTWSS
jgi:glyoxylase-like metal-dependent hydrolase (beta-lactamase superfamily II)